MALVYLALGSNLGNREANLRMAIRAMTRLAHVIDASSLYEATPVGPSQPSFYNAAVSLETGLQPLALLRFLKGIEEEIGRRRGVETNSPRPIDIDILLYGDEVIEEPTLTVPHPRMAERPFVLGPLSEIAGGAHHPVLDQSVAELGVAVGDAGVTRVADRGWDGVAGRPQARVRI
jgi:2-amino-4-hydroxy-6-hydroxymethyldihydropteridine diphosphokinase